MTDEERLRWLLAGDPAIVWQVQRDLLDRSPSTWQRTRQRVATEGWGARLLALQSEDASWGGGLYIPKWTSTFYTLRLLTHLGVPPRDPRCVAAAELLLNRGMTPTGGVALWTSRRTDTCVTAMLLAMACYFGLVRDPRCSRMLEWLLAEQMNDGGWNCERERRGAVHSSFHTTISVLEGLAAYASNTEGSAQMHKAVQRGQAFFLEHRLYRSSTTNREVNPAFSKFSFPPYWHFDVLRGLEYFASVNAGWDERLADAVALVEARRAADGAWRVQNRHTGKRYFDLEAGREPSRVNTLRALRVLRWVLGSGAKG